jgi:hypothetical protein
VQIGGIGREEWTALLQRFVDRSVVQAWEFPAAICPRHEVTRVVVRGGDGDARGMAQVRSLRLPVVGGGVAQVAAGPLWRRSGERPDPDDFAEVLAVLRDEFVSRRGLLLRVAPQITVAEGAAAVRALEDLGFRRNEASPPYRTFLLDLARPLQEIRAGLHTKARKALKATLAGTLELREGTDPALLRGVAPLYRSVASSKGFSEEVDLTDWERLAQTMPAAHRPRTFLACDRGVAVAGLVVFSEGGGGATGWPVVAAVTARGRELQAGYLLHWRATEWLHELGCGAFDLGGIDPVANPGTYQFKRWFGGTDVTYLGTWEARGRVRSTVVTYAGERALRAARHLAARFRR